MHACTFIGNHDCPASVMRSLPDTLTSLISRGMVDLFYVGNHGQFDLAAARALGLAKKRYPQIKVFCVPAFLPKKKELLAYSDCDGVILPDFITRVSPILAIPSRNRWMIDRSACVVTYIMRPEGNALQYALEARAKGKAILDLGRYRYWEEL